MTFLILKMQRYAFQTMPLNSLPYAPFTCTCLPFSIRLKFEPVSPNHAYFLDLFYIQTNCSKYTYSNLLHNFAVPPSIHGGPSKKTVNESSNLELSCNATGNPSPNMTWFIVADPSVTLASGEVLQVKNVSKNDSGVYQCMASNGFGRDALFSWIVAVNCKSINSNAMFFSKVIRLKNKTMKMILFSAEFAI